MTADLLFHDITELFTGSEQGVLRDAAVAIRGGTVCWVGQSTQAPPALERVDCRGLVGLPGLVDCHTHALFAGSRAAEFQRRLAGATYTEILEAGGGILSTVGATRAASLATLRSLLERRLEDMLALGVTTVEVKSGYGLEPDAEMRMLEAMAAAEHPVEIVPTFLGAHAVPLAFRGRREAYVEQVIREQLPRCAPLARFVDVYCDRGAFTLDEARAILEAGKAHGLIPRIHAEQVAHTGAAAMAAALGATSADHLEQLDEAGVMAMAEHGTVAVLLPGAQLYLKDPAPPVEALRRAGVPMAVSTDFNPGSSPVRDLWSCATLACLRMGLRVDEALLGITRNAARALGRDELGWLGVGAAADLALLSPPPGEPAELAVLVQYLGGHRASHVVKAGRWAIRDGVRVPDVAGGGAR
jgi:imidazolonepropionase